MLRAGLIKQIFFVVVVVVACFVFASIAIVPSSFRQTDVCQINMLMLGPGGRGEGEAQIAMEGVEGLSVIM